MHYVILRDDDTNALTPVECLEQLYRPFLDRNLPVNLAVIPQVHTHVTLGSGQPEGFLLGKNTDAPPTMPIRSNTTLVQYLLDNPGYHILQHGCHHDYFEFDGEDRADISNRLDRGMLSLIEAGFCRPQTFVAPYDKLSTVSLTEVSKRFGIVSTGWFELGRLPCAWWPRYCLKKLRRTPHWHNGHNLLLSHPGCLLSCNHSYDTMLERIKETVKQQTLTVLVTHWWEYFRNGQADDAFIRILHQTAEYLANEDEIQVIAFDDLLYQRMPLN